MSNSFPGFWGSPGEELGSSKCCVQSKLYVHPSQSVVSCGSFEKHDVLGDSPMVSPGPEKRSAPRKAVKVPAKVHTEHGDIPAEALNLSKSGIFLECATRVSEGSPVDIVMILPKEVTGDAAKWVCCHATVQRVQNHVGENGRYGVAAVVDRMQAMPELTWPDVDRRITERRGADRRKSARAEGQDRRGGDRRKSS
jgi:hypothetical protein